MSGLSSNPPPRVKADSDSGVVGDDRPDGAASPVVEDGIHLNPPFRESEGDKSFDAGQTSTARDAALVERLRFGEAEALERLMQLYDSAVRYAIFRTTRNQCLADPTWLDSVASEVWTGLCESLCRMHSAPSSLRAYLVQIARNRAISALRRNVRIRKRESTVGADAGQSDASTDEEGPAEVLGRFEELSALRECLAGLPEEDRHLVSQLAAITERRWVEAAAALGLAESTLRSRWKNVLKRLEVCVTGRVGRNFAPGRDVDD